MKMSKIIKVSLMTTILLLFIACTQNPYKEESTLEYQYLADLPKQDISFHNTVQPILAKRCVVCHGCYDAPCQLKLSSSEGIERGGSKEVVYAPRRFKPANPSRLFIDAKNKEQWRKNGFYSVLNEGNPGSQLNLQNSLMYRMLRLKQRHPQAKIGKLDSAFELDLERKLECPNSDEFAKFAEQKPGWGMPYGMPNLSQKDHKTIVEWLAQGSPVDAPQKISVEVKNQVEDWEKFFNKSGKQNQLVNRYIYEHLFLAHIHFKGDPENHFFRLVRATSRTGDIEEIATVRPYDDPYINHKSKQKEKLRDEFFYRLRPYKAIPVIKEHKVYELSAVKMQRYEELFLDSDYNVTKLPGYGADAANPIKTFKDIPPRSRYKFLLDNTFFFAEGFIKGPVCRGQVALNVIEDHFWLMFFDPDKDLFSLDGKFLEDNLDDFRLPAEKENNFDLLAILKDYYPIQKKFVDAKIAAFKKLAKDKEYSIDQAVDLIWDGGEEKNPNAALTIYRHYDSSSVSYGLNGEVPRMTWFIDFPLLERIHYLLVAGFDVYGNIGHQLSTRLYMDFLRMEGEDHFLAFMPVQDRKAIRDSWYTGIREKVKKYYKFNDAWQDIEVIKNYYPYDPQWDLNQRLIKHVQPLAAKSQQFNQCNDKPLSEIETSGACHLLDSQYKPKIRRFTDMVTAFKGDNLRYIPDVTFIKINMPGEDQDPLAYSIIHNKAYFNVTSLFKGEKPAEKRDISNDSLSIVNWLEGSYPNFFLEVDFKDLKHFTDRFVRLNSEKAIEQFIADYGIRRTNHKFWDISDWFHEHKAKAQPVRAGVFDLNRYNNL